MNNKILTLEEAFSIENLLKAFNKARKNTHWKESVQRYEMNLLSNISKLHYLLINNKYEPKKMFEFVLSERGKTRLIRAQGIEDRIVQRTLNDNILIPTLRPLLIYDNGASLKNRGIDFAKKRFKIHLQKAAKEYNNEAVVIFLDFSKYYDNIPHHIVLEYYKKYFSNEVYTFLKNKVIEHFKIDVSYMTNEEYDTAKVMLFNNNDHVKHRREEKYNAGEKFIYKSLAIGNQTSQITGVFYPYLIDNYIKIVKGIKYYGRYMDDSYIIMKNKAEAKKLLNELYKKYNSINISVNKKKTHIYKINNWLLWLKTKYKVINNYRIVQKIYSKNLRRERQRIIKHFHLLKDNRITFSKIFQCYKSWRGKYKKYDNYNQIKKMDKLFNLMFQQYTKKERIEIFMSWIKSRSNNRPKEVEIVSNNRYLLHRNIKEIKDEEGNTLYYDYEEKLITETEYKLLQELQNRDEQISELQEALLEARFLSENVINSIQEQLSEIQNNLSNTEKS